MHSITSQYLARYRRLDTGDGTPHLLPVTGAQRRFVLVRSLDRAGRPDLVPMFFAFPAGTVDIARLRGAAHRLARLHPVLRARPTVLRGTPVLALTEPDVPVTRVDRAPGESAAAALRRVLAAWEADGPAMRIFLVRDDGEDGRDGGAAEGPGGARETLAIVLDHAACDGQSLARIVRELTAAYAEDGNGERGAGAAEAELDAYRSAVLLHLDAEERASSPEALAYWGDRLRTVREHAPLPRAVPAEAPEAQELPSGAAELRVPAAPGGASFPVLLDACAAAARALYRTDAPVPLGYPWGGRPPGAAPVLGCFLNTVVFPAGGGAPVGGSTADAWWDDLDRADTPFDAVVRAARAAGSGWTGRLDGLLTVDDARGRPPLVLGGVTGREVHVDGRPVRGPFAVSVTQGADLHVRMVWDRAVLSDDTATGAFDALAGALRAAGAAAA
ncbi:non-ribosomal peptide synthetase [Streptomyces sp. NPDC005805]|uniref:non-ribosomal peptide synthetase n=1 Tax=Streptomyces sp. NPDC005805 TaxID=3157068 RepID=UPI0033DD4613